MLSVAGTTRTEAMPNENELIKTSKQSPKPIKKDTDGVMKYKHQKSGGKCKFYMCKLLEPSPASREGYKWIKYIKDGKTQEVLQSKLSEP